MNLGQLENRRYWLNDTLERALVIEMAQESAQVSEWRQVTDGSQPRGMGGRSIERPGACALTSVKRAPALAGYEQMKAARSL
jgi:hypothetical protein